MTGRRFAAAIPLAFEEAGGKKRMKSVMNCGWTIARNPLSAILSQTRKPKEGAYLIFS